MAYFIAMRRVGFSLLILAMILTTETVRGAENPLRRTRQALVVVAENWHAKSGVLRAFERTDATSQWHQRGADIPVMLGKKGLAWGRGIASAETQPGPRKVEGDNKVPAGIFRLGPAFGYASARAARWIKLRYVQSTESMEAVDDPRSRYYNQLIDRSKTAHPDWHSSELMRRADDLYKWGIFVGHNPDAVPGAGSCIFMHIWKDASTATVGCTAMAEPEIVRLLRWLDPAARPVLVQMPRGNYPACQASFGLPNLR
jgi:L,D-peptidoglycan transpeptidase YkuD (ErfK/YbiS/YcfS/YnhG family)